jgi:hypothetical protein
VVVVRGFATAAVVHGAIRLVLGPVGAFVHRVAVRIRERVECAVVSAESGLFANSRSAAELYAGAQSCSSPVGCGPCSSRRCGRSSGSRPLRFEARAAPDSPRLASIGSGIRSATALEPTA